MTNQITDVQGSKTARDQRKYFRRKKIRRFSFCTVTTDFEIKHTIETGRKCFTWNKRDEGEVLFNSQKAFSPYVLCLFFP